MTRAIYITSFCNRGHDLNTGRPIGHECYVIPPVALRIERDRGADVALDSAAWAQFYARKGRPVRGRRAP